MWKGEKGSSGKGFPKNLLGRFSFLLPLLKAHIVTIVEGVPDLPLTPPKEASAQHLRLMRSTVTQSLDY